jgi:hypothetical protein
MSTVCVTVIPTTYLKNQQKTRAVTKENI